MGADGEARASARKAPGREQQLLAAAQGGDGEALGALLARHRPFVVRLARTCFNGALAIEDLVQEGLLGLMEAIKRYDPRHPRGAT